MSFLPAPVVSLKAWGAALEERLRAPVYPGKVDRAILLTVTAWDVNCQQHIPDCHHQPGVPS